MEAGTSSCHYWLTKITDLWRGEVVENDGLCDRMWRGEDIVFTAAVIFRDMWVNKKKRINTELCGIVLSQHILSWLPCQPFHKFVAFFLEPERYNQVGVINPRSGRKNASWLHSYYTAQVASCRAAFWVAQDLSVRKTDEKEPARPPPIISVASIQLQTAHCPPSTFAMLCPRSPQFDPFMLHCPPRFTLQHFNFQH